MSYLCQKFCFPEAIVQDQAEIEEKDIVQRRGIKDKGHYSTWST